MLRAPIPPKYRASRGRIMSAAASTSSCDDEVERDRDLEVRRAALPAPARIPPRDAGGRARRGAGASRTARASRRRSRPSGRCSSGLRRRGRSGSARAADGRVVFSGLPSPVTPSRSVHRQRIVGPVRGDGRAPRDHVAHDRDVLARARQRLGERLAVPAFDDLRPRHPEPEDEAPAAQVVHRHRGHRRRGRPSRADLHDRGAEPDPRRSASPTRPAASARRSRTPPRSRSSRSPGARPRRIAVERRRAAAPRRPRSRCSGRA